jgi:uncharacterized protein YggU (UPF0235/DUF167 family)
MPAIEDLPKSCVLRLRVVPRAARTMVAGMRGDAILVRLAAAPVDGAANDALLAFLSDMLEVPRHRLTLRRGARGRDKEVHVAGLNAVTAMARLQRRP